MLRSSPMLKQLSFILLLIAQFTSLQAQEVATEDSICLSAEEFQLAELINEHRQSLGLPSVPISGNMMMVARAHVFDLLENDPLSKRCNLHSWSKKGRWKGCCYTGDERSAECMWNKPSEISDYEGYGYEIAYYQSAELNAESALEGWKNSKGHRIVIENKGMWKEVSWKAMGVAIEGEFAVVWFGREEDDYLVDSPCFSKN